MKPPKAMMAAMKAMKAKGKTSNLKYGPEDDCAFSSELEASG